MNPLHLHGKSALANCFRAASSPKCWQRSFAAQAAPAMGAIYRFKWIEQAKLETRLIRGPLMGRCLHEEMFGIGTPKIPPEEEMPRLVPVQTQLENQRRHAVYGHSPNKAAAETQSEKPSQKTNLCMPTGNSTTEKQRPNDRSKNLSQILKLKKTATRNKLKNVCANIGTDTRPIADGATDQSKRGDGDFRQTCTQPPAARHPFVQGLHTHSRHTPVLAPDKSTTSRWRHEIEHRVQQALKGFVGPCSNGSKNALHQPAREHPCASSLWKIPLVNIAHNSAPDGMTRLTEHQLVQLMKVRIPGHQPVAFGADPTSSRPTPGSPAQQNTRAPFDQLNPTLRGAYEKSESKRTTSEMPDGESQTEQEGRVRGVSQPGVSKNSAMDSQDHSELPVCDSPEFPPLPKIINDELRSSGKRTPLKSESSAVQAVNSLDEEELADAFKRILDDQARRHGIKL